MILRFINLKPTVRNWNCLRTACIFIDKARTSKHHFSIKGYSPSPTEVINLKNLELNAACNFSNVNDKEWKQFTDLDDNIPNLKA